jgi:monoterpene epsilon-lactone hydrolase
MEIAGIIILGLVGVVTFFALSYKAADHSQYDLPRTEPEITDAEVSQAHEGVVGKLNEFAKSASTDIKVSRQQLEDLFYRDVDAQIIDVDVDGIPGEWVLAEGADPTRRLLYLHGGAFRVGSPRSHRHITNELSKRNNLAVLAVDYRMQPEYRTVDCHDDARSAYRWILKNGPQGNDELKSLFVAGDSAGGNLTLSVIAWARDQGLRAVDGAIAFAPLTDFSFSSPSWKSNMATDPFLGPGFGPLLKVPRFLIAMMMRKPSGAPVNNPVLSPLLGDLADLPNTLIQVGRDEMLYGDSQRYANKAAAHGSEVTLQVWPKMVHVFQGFPELPEAEVALSNTTDFIRIQMGRNDAADASANIV